MAVVGDEPQLAELVHEMADSRASGADDLRQRLLADLRNHRLRLAFLSEISEQEKYPREPLLTRVEEVVHQVLLNSNVAREQIVKEYLGKRRLIMKHAYRVRLLDPHDRALGDGRDG